MNKVEKVIDVLYIFTVIITAIIAVINGEYLYGLVITSLLFDWFAGNDFIENNKITCDPVEILKALFSVCEISIATSDGREELIKSEQIHDTDGLGGVIIIQAEEI